MAKYSLSNHPPHSSLLQALSCSSRTSKLRQEKVLFPVHFLQPGKFLCPTLAVRDGNFHKGYITLQGQAQASNVGNSITVFKYRLKLSIARAYLPHPELSAFCLIPPCGHLEVELILSDGYQQAR